MSAGISDMIAALWQKYLDVGTGLNTCGDNLDAAGAALKTHNYGNAGYFLEQAAINIRTAANHTYGAADSVLYWSITLWQWIDFYWPEIEELTATTICEAWAKNGFEDRALTIAFIDRMRQLIWNEPFSVVWAARPEDTED